MAEDHWVATFMMSVGRSTVGEVIDDLIRYTLLRGSAYWLLVGEGRGGVGALLARLFNAVERNVFEEGRVILRAVEVPDDVPSLFIWAPVEELDTKKFFVSQAPDARQRIVASGNTPESTKLLSERVDQALLFAAQAMTLFHNAELVPLSARPDSAKRASAPARPATTDTPKDRDGQPDKKVMH